MTPTEKAIRGFCGRHADWWPSTTQVQEMLALAQPCPTCEALARTVMLDQTSHDAQRKEQELVAWEQFYPDIGKPQIAFNSEVIGYVAPQRTWVGLMRGVRVEGDTLVITVKGGNDVARELCGALIEEMNK